MVPFGTIHGMRSWDAHARSALDVSRYIAVRKGGHHRAEVSHSDPVAAADVDTAQQRDVGGHVEILPEARTAQGRGRMTGCGLPDHQTRATIRLGSRHPAVVTVPFDYDAAGGAGRRRQVALR